jgi:hypothetical protein
MGSAAALRMCRECDLSAGELTQRSFFCLRGPVEPIGYAEGGQDIGLDHPRIIDETKSE